MFRIKSDKIIVGETLFDGYVYVENSKIVELTRRKRKVEVEYDYTGKYVSSGFIDLHTHGAGGYNFMSDDYQDVIEACNCHLQFGTTTILPTLTTAPIEEMCRGLANVKKAKDSKQTKNRIVGAHLEGPYFSLNQCGAQAGECITGPIKADYESLIADYGAYIARWSFAPEKDENGEFCKYLTEHNIIASAGHTDAKYEDMQVAIKNGCNLITHLYSCTSTVTRQRGFRSLGVIESAYLRDELYVEIIADSKHLPPDLIKMIIKIKGTDKVALITDSQYVAGLYGDKDYAEYDNFIVEDGVAKLKDRSAFSGSIATANVCVRTLVKDCGYSIPTAVKMITETPASILKDKKIGRIAKDYVADFVVFDEKINVCDVFVNGEKVV